MNKAIIKFNTYSITIEVLPDLTVKNLIAKATETIQELSKKEPEIVHLLYEGSYLESNAKVCNVVPPGGEIMARSKTPEVVKQAEPQENKIVPQDVPLEISPDTVEQEKGAKICLSCHHIKKGHKEVGNSTTCLDCPGQLCRRCPSLGHCKKLRFRISHASTDHLSDEQWKLHQETKKTSALKSAVKRKQIESMAQPLSTVRFLDEEIQKLKKRGVSAINTLFC